MSERYGPHSTARARPRFLICRHWIDTVGNVETDGRRWGEQCPIITLAEGFVMTEMRNAQYNANGTIDVEINHPRYGWIPFTASPNDPDATGRELFAAAQSVAAPYVAPDPAVVAAQELAAEREKMIVSRFQARAALLGAGLLTSAEAAIEGADAMSQLAWQDAQEFRRNSPTVLAIASQLSLTETQVDDLFRQAATIEA